jgi:hypothetical protein
VAAVLLAVSSSGSARPPRLWLESKPVHDKAAGGAATRVLEIKLVLEAGSAPVEVHTLSGVMPRLRDASGKDVVLGDWRAVAGMAPPQPPQPPQPPLSPGQRHVVCSYTVVRRAEGGYHLLAPYGGADVPAGTYAITARLDLTPTTREQWMAQYRAASFGPLQPPGGPKAKEGPEQAADKYAAHWPTVAGFFTGRLEAPEISFTLR